MRLEQAELGAQLSALTHGEGVPLFGDDVIGEAKARAARDTITGDLKANVQAFAMTHTSVEEFEASKKITEMWLTQLARLRVDPLAELPKV